MSEFFDSLNKINKQEIEKWKIDREKYLNECKTWT